MGRDQSEKEAQYLWDWFLSRWFRGGLTDYRCWFEYPTYTICLN